MNKAEILLLDRADACLSKKQEKNMVFEIKGVKK